MHDFEYQRHLFNCSEQAMMYYKALAFLDTETARKILQERHPRNQKAHGRNVKNFDPQIWDDIKYNIVKKILIAKFEVPEFREELLKHKGKIFVEASPTDAIWGIGFSETDALSNIDNWGENLLGKILTELSNEI